MTYLLTDECKKIGHILRSREIPRDLRTKGYELTALHDKICSH